jgi:hypothetical protein
MDGTYMGCAYFSCDASRGVLLPALDAYKEERVKIFTKGDEGLQVITCLVTA